MKFTATPAEKSSVKLEVSASVEEVAAAIEAAVRHLSQQTKIPGFRPGKAPRSMVERVAGSTRLLDEATEILVEKGYREAVIGTDTMPLASPKVEATPVVEDRKSTRLNSSH